MLMDKGDEILPGRSIDDFLCHEGDKPLEEDTRRIYRNALLELRDFFEAKWCAHFAAVSSLAAGAGGKGLPGAQRQFTYHRS